METSICCSSALLLPGIHNWQSNEGESSLTIRSAGIEHQIIEERFGQHGSEFRHGMPCRSLPLSIESAPVETKSFALTLIDYDAVEALGVSWVHWLLCNFTERELPENASVEWSDRLTQGVNSWSSLLLGSNALSRHDATGYGGMAPPDRPHRYDLTVYALSGFLNLQNGFSWNRLMIEMAPHLLAAATISGVYRK